MWKFCLAGNVECKYHPRFNLLSVTLCLSLQIDLLLLEAVVLIQQSCLDFSFMLHWLMHGHPYSLTSDSSSSKHIVKSRHAHIFACKNLCTVTRVYGHVWFPRKVHPHWNYMHKYNIPISVTMYNTIALFETHVFIIRTSLSCKEINPFEFNNLFILWHWVLNQMSNNILWAFHRKKLIV